jgi:hypothetical protein
MKMADKTGIAGCYNSAVLQIIFSAPMISEVDCWAEGIEEVIRAFDLPSQIDMSNRLGCSFEEGKPLFAQLWESINGVGSWDINPWVWRIEFRRIAQ